MLTEAMKQDFLMRDESLPIKIYLDMMNEIEFMQAFKQDPDVFNPESDKFKNFLIQSFCYLHPDFHYLSFLNTEDTDSEIIKAAEILQIFPTNSNKKRYKIFDNMSKSDIHKFWLRFFNLFKKENDISNFGTDSLFNISWEHKINFFKDIRGTFNYLNYQFPILNSNRFIDFNVTKELNNWKELRDDAIITLDESLGVNIHENERAHVNIDDLITNLQQIVALCSYKKPINQGSEPENMDFYTAFIKLTKNILLYKNNLIIANSMFLDDNNLKLLPNYENLSGNFYFIKRFNNIVKTLKSEMKSVY